MDGLAAERAFFFALAVVGFDALGAETVQADFVDYGRFYHFLADWAGQSFLYSTDEIEGDHVMQV